MVNSAQTEKNGSEMNITSENSMVSQSSFDDNNKRFIENPLKLVKKMDLFYDTPPPVNVLHSGIYKQSYAYVCLKDRMPVILTKIIDHCSKKGGGDMSHYISFVSKLKSDLVTNKPYDLFSVKTPEAERWNHWLNDLDQCSYFTNNFLWTECYIYRKLREGCELYPSLSDMDPFEDQKAAAFHTGLEPMCVLAERMGDRLVKSDRDVCKQDFMTLLKSCLWANKCDLCLTIGEPVNLLGATGDQTHVAVDPLQMLLDLKENLCIDESGDVFENLYSTSSRLRAERDKNTSSDTSSKTQSIYYDIICDNTGYEVFADLCFATFLISQELVDIVRFHVKKYPWFVSDVTLTDFKNLIAQCATAEYSRVVDTASGPRTINSDGVKSMALRWQNLLDEGKLVILAEDFWTYPHPYQAMKQIDPTLYQVLQASTGALFKGDLNYRKLLGERNAGHYEGFTEALLGFNPCPVTAARTVKSEIVCGLPAGMDELLYGKDPKWMLKGDYGLIQFCSNVDRS